MCQALHLIFGIPVLQVQEAVGKISGKSGDIQAQCNEWLTQCSSQNFDPYRVEIKGRYKTVFECFSSIRAMYGLGSNNAIVNCFTGEPIPADTDVAFGIDGTKVNTARDGLNVMEEELEEKRRLMKESGEEGDYETAAALKKEIKGIEDECHKLRIKADKFDKLQNEVQRCELAQSVTAHKRPRPHDGGTETFQVEMFTAITQLAEKQTENTTRLVKSVTQLACAIQHSEATKREMNVKLTECIEKMTEILNNSKEIKDDEETDSATKRPKKNDKEVKDSDTESANESKKNETFVAQTVIPENEDGDENISSPQPEPFLGQSDEQ